MSQLHVASVQTNAPRPDDAAIIVSEFPLNHHQSFRAEIITRDGKSIVSIARWKKTPSGARRTGQSLEFGAHRVAAISGLLSEVQRLLAASNKGGAQ
jgi:hypothetical protein